MDLADELQKVYDSEINVSISWLWDGGIDVRWETKSTVSLPKKRSVSSRESDPGCNRPSRTFTPILATPDRSIVFVYRPEISLKSAA